MSETPMTDGAPAKTADGRTIGAVCEALSREFPDLTISKIR